MNAITLSISDTLIRQDEAGRFCLNDLHKASGGEKRHNPSYWLENKQTIDFVSLLTSEQRDDSVTGIPVTEQNQPLKIVQGGSSQGTFGVWELVYHYAMWISAEFNLKVIRAYHALVTAKPNALKALPEPPTITKAQAGELHNLVADKARGTGKPNAYFWSRFNNHFKVASYRELPANRFAEAVDYLAKLEGDCEGGFLALTHKELSDLIRQNVERFGQQQSLTVNISLGDRPKTPQQWLLSYSDSEFNPLTLKPLPEGSVAMPPLHFADWLEKAGWVVMKKEELSRKIMEAVG